MIDWGNVAANALWILGCALALATLSYASWQASINHEKLVTRLAQPRTQLTFSLCGILICAGLAATSTSMIATVLWVALGVLFLIQFGLHLRKTRSPKEELTPQDHVDPP